jgi:hypothetical protein
VIPVRTTKNPQPIGARHQWHPRSRPLFSGFPLFPKKPGRSFVPFFLLPRSNSPRLGLVRNALPAAPVLRLSLSFQPLASSSANSTPLDHLAISHSVTELSLTHSIHRANNIICATPLPACRNIGVRGCCRNNWLARNPAKPTSLQTISQSPSTSARDALKHPHSDRSTGWQLNSTFPTFQLRSKAISHIPPPPHTNWSKQVGRLSNYETRQGLELGGRE